MLREPWSGFTNFEAQTFDYFVPVLFGAPGIRFDVLAAVLVHRQIRLNAIPVLFFSLFGPIGVS